MMTLQGLLGYFESSPPLMAEQKSRATMVEFSDRNMEDFATGVWMWSGETQIVCFLSWIFLWRKT